MIFNKSKKLSEENALLKQELLKKEEQLNALNKKVSALEDEKNKLSSENALLKENSEKIIEDGKRKQEEILKQAHQRYSEEILRLRLFVARWLQSLPEHKERTPETRKRTALAVALSEILKDNPCTENLDEGVKLIEKLNDAISGGKQEAGGFNLEEVLNPSGELDLATLCKELGVMD